MQSIEIFSIKQPSWMWLAYAIYFHWPTGGQLRSILLDAKCFVTRLQRCDLVCLTVVVNSKGHVGSDDVVETNLAVLWGAVGVESLGAHDAVKEPPLWDRGLVATLHEHGGELVDVVDPHVYGGPDEARKRCLEGKVGGAAGSQHDRAHLWDFLLLTASGPSPQS